MIALTNFATQSLTVAIPLGTFVFALVLGFFARPRAGRNGLFWPSRPISIPQPQKAPDPTAPSGTVANALLDPEPSAPLVHLYTTLVDLLRDQVAAQMEQASTNDLKAVGVLGAALAMVVALLLIRATNPTAVGSWWWYPLPFFVVPAAIAATPLQAPSSTRTFRDGPSVPALLARLEEGKVGSGGAEPYGLEELLGMILVDLHTCWDRNDHLLDREQRAFYRGAAALGVVTLVTVGMLGACRRRCVMNEDQQPTVPEGSAATQEASPQASTPVVIPHIDFDTPTGNPLVEVRKGFGLTPLSTRSSDSAPEDKEAG
jgi:hypothetical protein